MHNHISTSKRRKLFTIAWPWNPEETTGAGLVLDEEIFGQAGGCRSGQNVRVLRQDRQTDKQREEGGRERGRQREG